MAIPRTIRIGYVGDKMYRHQDIDISDLLVDYPTAVATLYHKRASDDDGYPVVTEMVDSHTLRWTFSDVDAAEKGYGEAVIVMATSDGAHIGRSHVIETVTGRSIVTDEDVPEAYTPYINQVSTLKAQMKTISDHIDSVAEQIDVDTIKAEIDSAKTTAVNAVSAQGTSSKTVVANQGTASKAEVTAQATKAKGEINTLTSGFSATVAAGVASVQSAQTTAESSIDTKRASFETYATSQFEEIATKVTQAETAKTGAETAKTGAEAVLTTIQQKLASGEFKGDKGDPGTPGTNGVNGQNGADGADGFSPTATVTKTGTTSTISITDKNGTTTASVTDGVNGQDGRDGVDGRDGRDGSDASVTKTNVINALTGMTSSEQDNACAVIGAERAKGDWELILSNTFVFDTASDIVINLGEAKNHVRVFMACKNDGVSKVENYGLGKIYLNGVDKGYMFELGSFSAANEPKSSYIKYDSDDMPLFTTWAGSGGRSSLVVRNGKVAGIASTINFNPTPIDKIVLEKYTGTFYVKVYAK